MKIYLAGPMRGIPEFNFPLFHQAAAMLREIGHEVFSPAEKDIERHGTDISKGNITGSLADAVDAHQFSARDAIHDDLTYIAKEANAIALLPGWENSSGVNVELALAKFLKGAGVDFKFIYLFTADSGRVVWAMSEHHDALHNP